ncbi:hypothetical protein E2C01_036826 [Portunus trituberculatus]|uniref:Uncharacterized protein n=1 Tax=Portunus trituberculatus TaxID=210409 RepID=A0A5B7FCA2_PORTR|nr:hypothetical protein [Portunus trituberculatus]
MLPVNPQNTHKLSISPISNKSHQVLERQGQHGQQRHHSKDLPVSPQTPTGQPYLHKYKTDHLSLKL